MDIVEIVEKVGTLEFLELKGFRATRVMKELVDILVLRGYLAILESKVSRGIAELKV